MKRILISLLAGIAFSLSVFAQEATVTETQTTMKTYPFGDPNPVAMPQNSYYPYFRYDGFAVNGTPKAWKSVVLENNYIKVIVLPEIGGKVWTATDKTTGRDFIYNNHVVKFRDIAMRGPWTSGGIEFNFGIIGHAPTASTPVDYTTARKSDGSVSCYISSYEYITRTYWTVEINVPKDKAYFTTHTTWHNGSSLDEPYYQWMNAAFKASNDLQFCFPGNHYIFHDGISHLFPIDNKGRNISWYKNNNFESSKSYHVLGYHNDFYGGYWHDSNSGFVHYATPDSKLGMKIWIWSLADDGAIWKDLLTDTDGQYVELQAGRMFNQPGTDSSFTPFKQSSFTPQGTDEWTEYWYPVEDIKGIAKASRIGAMNVIRDNDQVKVLFSPVESGTKTLSVISGGKVLATKEMHLETLKPWSDTFSLEGLSSDAKLKFVVGNDELVYSQDIKDNEVHRPLVLPSEFDWNSTYGLYVKGEQYMNSKSYSLAESNLRDCLKKDPYFAPALVRLASLLNHTGRYEEAEQLSRRALSLNTYDGEANYVNAFANKQLGNITDAKDGFSVATYQGAFRSAAYAELAGISIAEKDYNKALENIDKSLMYNVKNFDALQEKILCYRYTNKTAEGEKLIADILKDNPLLHSIRYESYLLHPTEAAKKEFQSLVRNELPDETYIELALWYADKECPKEALELCSFTNNNPIANYLKAYLLRNTDEQGSASALKSAVAASPKMVFPFRPEMLRVLAWADSVKPCWQTKYYEALTFYANQDKETALKLLNQCDDATYAPLFITRASMRKGAERLADLQKAEKIQQDWRTGDELIEYYMDAGQWKQADAVAAKYGKKYPDNYVIGLKRGKTLYKTGQYQKSINLLKHLTVLPNEGAYEGREVYRNANLYYAIDCLSAKKYQQAKTAIDDSKKWIENLGVGKPYDDLIDYRMENYLEAIATIGNKDMQTSLLASVAKGVHQAKEFTSNDLLSVIAMRKLGRTEEADKTVASWKEAQPDNVLVKWCTAVYHKDKTTADKLLQSKNMTRDLLTKAAQSNLLYDE